MASSATEQAPIGPVDLAAEREAVGPVFEEKMIECLRSGAYVLGPEVKAFESEFAAYQRTAHALGVASGTDALILGLRALGVGVGDGVLTSAYTFFASAGTIAWVGARPQLVDVDYDTGLITPETAAAAIDETTKCVLPVHLYGQLADVMGFRALADKAGISFLEDAAQAHGAERDGKRAGEVGDATAFSFYPTKNLGAPGDAGAILTPSDEVAGRLRELRDHGSREKYRHDSVGTNSRLASLQACALRTKLPHLDAWTDRRAALAARYDERFADSDKVRPLTRHEGTRHVYHQYSVRLPAELRDGVAERLREQSIFAAVHYPSPVHHQPVAAEWGYGPDAFPNAARLSTEILCLPVHPFLSDEQVDRVSEALLGALSA